MKNWGVFGFIYQQNVHSFLYPFFLRFLLSIVISTIGKSHKVSFVLVLFLDSNI